MKGKTMYTNEVVNQIAGHAARTVKGVHSLGKTNIIDRLKGGKALDAGMKSEVGEQEVAFDVDLVVAYGHPVQEVAENLRSAITNQVKTMLARDVVECNINVVGVHFDEEEKEPAPEPTPRVR
ncbi:MAG: Asp23/Gls24 family envelope stress response protein [Pseudomonadota bacterium]